MLVERPASVGPLHNRQEHLARCGAQRPREVGWELLRDRELNLLGSHRVSRPVSRVVHRHAPGWVKKGRAGKLAHLRLRTTQGSDQVK